MNLKPGDMLSHYRLAEKIGEGGMGLIFRADDVRLRRPVALKLLSGSAAEGGESRERLVREARAAAALNHPGICTIYEVHEGEDVSFIAMEFVPGETLHDLLAREGPPPLERILDIAVEVAEALAAAHASRIVHRDLKPRNIMITPQGRTKILDFGLAIPAPPGETGEPPADLGTTRSLDRTATGGEARSAGIHGTLPYMSPEQALCGAVDARSDLFSFGTVLYEMATGRRPFEAAGATATLAKILEAEPEPPSRLNPSLPEALDRVALRCLRKKAEERYADASELLAALAELRRPGADAASGADRAGSASAAALSSTTIAVFPFAVRGSDRFRYLGDGMVDLLSTKLDGAGDLRSVDAHVVLGSLAREAAGALTPERARGLAGRFGAGLFVLGNVLEAGGRIQMNASLYESCGGAQVVSRGTVRGDADGIFDMVDDLTTQLLTLRCGGPESRFSRIAALATGSFDALKSYLEGEAEMRAMRREPAVEAYRRSVAADPGFSLAWYRLSVAALWSGRAELAGQAAREALRHAGRLSARDSRLLEAFHAVLQGENDEAERLYRSLLGDHPDDVEAWYQLGEVQFHAGPLRGRPIADSAAVWERVVALDPGHVNAIVHLGAIAASGGDKATLENLVRRVLTLSPTGDAATWMRAVHAFALGDQAAQDEVGIELRRAPDITANWAIRAVAAYLGDLEAGRRLAAALIEPVRSPEIRALGHGMRAHLDLARGRWLSARAEIGAAAAFDHDQAMSCLGHLAAAPLPGQPDAVLETVRADLERWRPQAPPAAGSPASRILPRKDLYAHERLYFLGLLSARLGDDDAALARAEELLSAPTPPDAAALVREMHEGLRARVAWARGRRDEALEALLGAKRPVRFDLILPSPFHSQADERFTLAGWLEASGRHREALSWYASFERGAVYDLIYAIPSRFHLGAVHERLGEMQPAAAHYRRFAAAWRDCDPDLTPRLDEAVAALARLGVPDAGG